MVDEFGYLKCMHFLHNKNIRIEIVQVMNKDNMHRKLCRVSNENTQASALLLSYALLDREL
jgi:hypothetical protein